MTSLIQRVQEYLEDKHGDSQPELLCRIYMRRIDHLYYKVGVASYHMRGGEGGEQDDEV